MFGLSFTEDELACCSRNLSSGAASLAPFLTSESFSLSLLDLILFQSLLDLVLRMTCFVLLRSLLDLLLRMVYSFFSDDVALIDGNLYSTSSSSSLSSSIEVSMVIDLYVSFANLALLLSETRVLITLFFSVGFHSASLLHLIQNFFHGHRMLLGDMGASHLRRHLRRYFLHFRRQSLTQAHDLNLLRRLHHFIHSSLHSRSENPLV